MIQSNSWTLEYLKTWCLPSTSGQAVTKFIREGEEETGRGDNLQTYNFYLWEQSDCKEKYMIKKTVIECLLNRVFKGNCKPNGV